MSFDSLGLSEPLLKAILEKGYDKPSPIQEQAIPAIINGHDVMAAAQTGTGKTAGFTLPLLNRLANGELARANHACALILTPTRELAAQVAASVETYGKYLPLHCKRQSKPTLAIFKPPWHEFIHIIFGCHIR